MAERDIQVSVINTHAEKGSEEYATKPSLDGVNLFLRAWRKYAFIAWCLLTSVVLM